MTETKTEREEIESLRQRIAELERERERADHELHYALANAQASADRADTLERALRGAGVCMGCWGGFRPTYEPQGCTDCLGTGWDGGAPAAVQSAQSEASRWKAEAEGAREILYNARVVLCAMGDFTPHGDDHCPARAMLPSIDAFLSQHSEDGR